MGTPARIGRRTGVIQVNKTQFEAFTIPMRMAILLHEFSHFYLNEKMDDVVHDGDGFWDGFGAGI